jgi:putative ABC transport system ATP-binding protein
VLRTERLTRVVGDKILVDQISVEIEAGRVVAIVGPSGAGKTSFLRLINRLDEPSAGTVYLEGTDYRTIHPAELRRRVGMVMQAANLFPGTIADNLRFGPRQHGRELTDRAIADLLTQVSLPGTAGRDVIGLSGGEAQRVSLARTLANEPDMLLLDEPTSALDEATEREVEALICGIIQQRQLTCLIVTHDMAQARRIAGQAMVLEGGRLAGFGPVAEVLGA